MMREHINNLKATLNQLNGVTDFEQIKELLQVVIDEVHTMDIEVSSQEDIIDSYINENKEYKEKIVELQDIIHSYEDESLASRNIKKELEDDRELYISKCEELEKRNAELEGKINVETENNAPLVKEVFKSLQRIETGVSKMNNKLDSNTEGLRDVVVATDMLDKSISVLIDTNKDVNEITEVYQETINEFREDITLQEEEISSVQQEVKQIFEDVKEVKNDTEEIHLTLETVSDECNKNTKFLNKLKGIFNK